MLHSSVGAEVGCVSRQGAEWKPTAPRLSAECCFNRVPSGVKDP